MELDGLIWLPVSTVVRAKRGLYAMKSIIRHGAGTALKSSDEFRTFIMVYIYGLFIHLHCTQGGQERMFVPPTPLLNLGKGKQLTK